jgi:hypothetical protein
MHIVVRGLWMVYSTLYYLQDKSVEEVEVLKIVKFWIIFEEENIFSVSLREDSKATVLISLHFMT